MSIYNLLFGQNPNSDVALALIGLKECDVERFRDCHMDEEGISIYARTGGGNRESYPNEILTSNPNYIKDEDDSFDSTYATFYFNYPEDIKEDCLKLLDMNKNGVPPSIIKKVNETFSRESTENDIWADIYHKQQQVYKNLRYSLDVYETNGHTIVPLSDGAMEKLLEAAEENTFKGLEGKFLPMWIRPYKLNFHQEVPRWSSEKDNLCRIKIDLGDTWEIDKDIWQRYKDKFSDKYPNAMKALQEAVD